MPMVSVKSISVDPMTAVPIREFGKKFKPPIAYETIRFWCTQGRLNRKTQQRVKLDSVYLPCGLCTNEAAFRRFVDRLNSSEICATQP